jgi:hypothetical protein
MPIDTPGAERPSPFDSDTLRHIRKGAEGLREEFRGIFSIETIDRAIQESIKELEGARIQQFVPIFVHRFTRERLRTMARLRGSGEEEPQLGPADPRPGPRGS